MQPTTTHAKRTPEERATSYAVERIHAAIAAYTQARIALLSTADKTRVLLRIHAQIGEQLEALEASAET